MGRILSSLLKCRGDFNKNREIITAFINTDSDGIIVPSLLFLMGELQILRENIPKSRPRQNPGDQSSELCLMTFSPGYNHQSTRFVYFQIRRHWGGGIMGNKSQARVAKIEKARAKELAKKMG